MPNNERWYGYHNSVCHFRVPAEALRGRNDSDGNWITVTDEYFEIGRRQDLGNIKIM